MRWRAEPFAPALAALLLAGCVVGPGENFVNNSAYIEDIVVEDDSVVRQPVSLTCPIGGEKFSLESSDANSHSSGSMADGMRISPGGGFPSEVYRCPGNGLAVYRDYKPKELRRLAGVIATPEYQALRGTETDYYLAYRLALALGDSLFVPHLLLTATWEAKNQGSPERARRYNEEFVALIRSLRGKPATLEMIIYRARAANALRELGRFEEAEAFRASIVVGPGIEPEAADYVRTEILTPLASVIARRDTSRDPIEMVGPRMTSMRCRGMERSGAPRALTPFEEEYCRRPENAIEAAPLP